VVTLDAGGLGALEQAAGARSAAPLDDAERRAPLRPDHPAYVIHTSGSTGVPKAVVVPHGGIARLLANHRRTLFAPAEAARGRRLRIAHAWPFAFDASWQPVLGLLDGHELHLADDDVRSDPRRLVDLLVTEGIDMIEVTPSFLGQLAAAGLFTAEGGCPLALLGVGGEAVPEPQWAELAALPHTDAWNFYGPTECTVDTVVARVRDGDRPVIGGPVDGTTAQVLDSHLRPVPAGVAGELYLGGGQLARGYLGRPDLTAERFVADPSGSGGRVYRTGDVVRWTAGGRLEFVGRADDQVKIRGFRVEPGEVEAAIGQEPDVAQVAVVVSAPGAGRPHCLVAYVVPRPGTALDASALRNRSAARLPAHLVPAAVVVVGALPITANGKLDRDALPEPDFAAMVRGTAPRNDREAVLVTLFATVLDLPLVGVDDDFVDLGGDSLGAMRLARLAADRGLAVTPRQVLRLRTAASIAEHVSRG
jgi:amino acid adenylation domain-containing protein